MRASTVETAGSRNGVTSRICEAASQIASRMAMVTNGPQKSTRRRQISL